MFVVTALLMTAAAAAPTTAAGAPPDPSSNFFVDPSCPTPDVCLQQTVQYLDQARARLGQPAYRLPSDFFQLGPAEQAFVLTNLDRILYGLTPVAGLTDSLDQAAGAGVLLDTDPDVSGPDVLEMTSNWAGGYENLPLAYGSWMYDDGPGSDNLDCPTAGSSGCWGHRDNILWQFSGTGPLAMGAAAGADAGGTPSDAMLLVQYDSAYRPTYVYTWSQAVAAGAEAGSAAPLRAHSRIPRLRMVLVLLRVIRHAISFHLIGAPPGARLSCSLARRVGRRWLTGRSRHCRALTTYRRLHPGMYRLRVRAVRRTLTRYAVVR
jgi:hypothetical protein